MGISPGSMVSVARMLECLDVTKADLTGWRSLSGELRD
jgi:hypothetical protein